MDRGKTLEHHERKTEHLSSASIDQMPGIAAAVEAEHSRFAADYARVEMRSALTRAWPLPGGAAAWEQAIT
jgi:hypothetical protein